MQVNELLKRFNKMVTIFGKGGNHEDIIALDFKKYHTLRVLENVEFIVKDMQELTPEEKDLARIIAILHDIGRLRQWKNIRSYEDRPGQMHAHIGARMLENGWLKVLVPEERKYDSEIIKIVYHHGDLYLPDDMSDREKLLSNLVRDADKVDILYLVTQKSELKIMYEEGEKEKNLKLNKKIKKNLLQKETVSFADVENRIDLLGLRLALINQLVFPRSREYIASKGYTEEMINLFEKAFPQYDKEDIAWLRNLKDLI